MFMHFNKHRTDSFVRCSCTLRNIELTPLSGVHAFQQIQNWLLSELFLHFNKHRTDSFVGNSCASTNIELTPLWGILALEQTKNWFLCEVFLHETRGGSKPDTAGRGAGEGNMNSDFCQHKNHEGSEPRYFFIQQVHTRCIRTILTHLASIPGSWKKVSDVIFCWGISQYCWTYTAVTYWLLFF